MKEINPPPEHVESLPAPRELSSSQRAYQAAYHLALSEAIESRDEELSKDELASELGRLEGEAHFLRDRLTELSK